MGRAHDATPTTPDRAPALKRKRGASKPAEATPTPVKRTRRRGQNNAATLPEFSEVVDLTGDSPVKTPAKQQTKPRARRTPNSAADSTNEERRARRFRARPPQSLWDRLARAATQRMFVVGHNVVWTDENTEFPYPQMTFDMVGTTGNMYKTTIGKVPSCDCPDATKRGTLCKHICYVLVNVLKATTHLQYQAAFLSSELREIYHHSPLAQKEAESKPGADTNGNRKPIEGDCPICFMEFEPDKEDIVWCRAACGNNVHKACFEKWAITQRSVGVRCVYCRSPWETDHSTPNLETLKQNGTVSEDGYVNVAQQMGLSGQRDYSTYHQPWAYRGSYSSGWRRSYYPDYGEGGY
ncbi:RING finger domain-containing protein [Aspergillus campestris IBT 28561]|uniref:RING finger domain-containing protein n=1 Tax=Aspergillus campestris (strain IBT 28561) TaxID=1392248 RepID=A0A2I1CWB1_ASPC2|nr:RING finger domain-containing protein [Aspergillus campestris IBT 28561]PKY01907.1 RING finger domain-containing protein [Aspergillus campestris IBT 28561]